MFPIFVLLWIMLISCDLCPTEIFCRKSRVITKSHKIFTTPLFWVVVILFYIFFLHMLGWQLKLLWNFIMPVKELVGITYELWPSYHRSTDICWEQEHEDALPFFMSMLCITMWTLYSIKFQGRCPSQPKFSGSIVDSSFLCFLSCTMVDNKFFVRYQL